MSEHNPYEAPRADISARPPAQADRLASRGARFWASLIDAVPPLALLAPFAGVGDFWDHLLAGELSPIEELVYIVAITAAYLVANGYLLATRGQTIGKLLLRIRVTSRDDGQLLPFTRLVTHRVVPYCLVGGLPVVGPVLSLVNCLFIFRDDRRCVHDLIAGTIVVRTDAEGAA